MSNEICRYVNVSHLGPGMKNLNLTFIIVDVGQSRRTSQGHDVRTVRVADATGSISMGIWDDLGGCISAGEIWRLRNGYTTVHKGCLVLSCGKMGELLKTGEFFMVYSETPNMSEYVSDLASKHSVVGKGPPEEEICGNDFSNNGSMNHVLSTNTSNTQKPVAPPQRPLKRRGSAVSHDHYASHVARRSISSYCRGDKMTS